MLVPLTASLYVPGTLDEADKKTMAEGKDYCERKINLLKSNFDQLVESKDTVNSRSRGANNPGSRGGRSGSDRYIGRGGSSHYSSNGWNTLLFLWGVFKGRRKNCSNFSKSVCIPDSSMARLEREIH